MNTEISNEKFNHIANLSKLKFKDSEIESYKNNLSAIVDYLTIIDNAKIENVETYTISSKVREDVVIPSYTTESMLKNAEHKNNDSYIVPKVVE